MHDGQFYHVYSVCNIRCALDGKTVTFTMTTADLNSMLFLQKAVQRPLCKIISSWNYNQVCSLVSNLHSLKLRPSCTHS